MKKFRRTRAVGTASAVALVTAALVFTVASAVTGPKPTPKFVLTAGTGFTITSTIYPSPACSGTPALLYPGTTRCDGLQRPQQPDRAHHGANHHDHPGQQLPRPARHLRRGQPDPPQLLRVVHRGRRRHGQQPRRAHRLERQRHQPGRLRELHLPLLVLGHRPVHRRHDDGSRLLAQPVELRGSRSPSRPRSPPPTPAATPASRAGP